MKPGVCIRLAPDLFASLEAAASRAGLSKAGWVRQEIVRALPNRSEFHSLPPSPPRRPATIPSADLVEVSTLAAAIARTGGALVQLCRVLRETGHAAHTDTENALADLRSVQSDVARLVSRLSR